MPGACELQDDECVVDITMLSIKCPTIPPLVSLLQYTWLNYIPKKLKISVNLYCGNIGETVVKRFLFKLYLKFTKSCEGEDRVTASGTILSYVISAVYRQIPSLMSTVGMYKL